MLLVQSVVDSVVSRVLLIESVLVEDNVGRGCCWSKKMLVEDLVGRTRYWLIMLLVDVCV